jgi:hypothetical protein
VRDAEHTTRGTSQLDGDYRDIRIQASRGRSVLTGKVRPVLTGKVRPVLTGKVRPVLTGRVRPGRSAGGHFAGT